MTKLVWIDIETTGLKPVGDEILEIALAESRLDDPFNIKHVYHRVLKFQRAPEDPISPFVLEMHTKNGLFEECAKSDMPCLIALQEAARLIVAGTDKDNPPVLAGSSVHFDHSFIRRYEYYAEELKLISHRYYDVSAIKLFCQSLGMPKFRKGEAHRAVPDIEESVAHAAQCALWLKDGVAAAVARKH